MTKPALRLVPDANGELPSAEDPVLTCLRNDYDALVRELATVIRQRDALKADKEAKMRGDKQFPEAHDLFDEWRTECGHPNAEFDPARMRLALSAVRRYKKHREQLSWVIQCGKLLAYVAEDGERHDGFGLLFRDSDHIERYANKYARWKARQA
jgi:uncharacterized protein with PIN domain